MAGTVQGGQAAAVTNKARYGDDFYTKIGSKGGTATHLSGKLALVSFAADRRTRFEKLLRKPKRAAMAGKKGGSAIRHRRPPVAPLEAHVPTVKKKLSGYYKPVVSIIPPHNTFYVFIPNKEQ